MEVDMTSFTLSEENSRQRGRVQGPFMVEELVCQRNHVLTSKGIFMGSDPLKYSVPLVLMQMALIVLTTRLLFYFIRPLKQGMISAQVLAGIILGPSLLGQNAKYTELVLPVGGKITLQTVSNIGFVIHLFLLGLRIDPSIIRKAGSKAFLIGSASYAFPFTLGHLAVMVFVRAYHIPSSLMVYITMVIPMCSMTSFPVTTTVLAELNILNSELGRLATNCAIVCETCNWVAALFYDLYKRQRTLTSVGAVMWDVALLFVIVFVCRPLVVWLTEKKTKKVFGKEEIPFFPIFVILMLVSLAAETLGIHAAYGAFWLGVSLPDGPPLGTGLAMRLDSFATGLLLPCFMSISGFETNFFMVGQNHAGVIEVVILVTYSSKILGTVIASAYCKTQARDALCLAFMMSCQGIIELYTSIMWKDAKLLNTECFNLVIINLLLVTGISRVLIVYLYDPSKRYKSTNKRTILNARQRNLQLRLLLCIYDDENIPPLVNFLEASYPTRFSPIAVCTLHLVELKGRAHAVLVPHHRMNKLDPNTAKSTLIENAFRRFEQQNQGTVTAQHFTAVAPFTSIHDDICTLALDKKSTLVVIPFHKQYAIDGTVGHVKPAIRNINRNVLEKAPCSVGMFIDRCEASGCRSILMNQTSWKNIAMLFVGGSDDAEALALCLKMAEHPDTSVTMIHFKHTSSVQDGTGTGSSSSIESTEAQLIEDFKSFAANKENVKYREEVVKDGEETSRVISSLGNSYEMVIVGRDHDLESSLWYGLTEWSECPELGVIGDMLASPEFHFSVLVIHQQPGDFLDYDEGSHRRFAGEFRIHPRDSCDQRFSSVHCDLKSREIGLVA